MIANEYRETNVSPVLPSATELDVASIDEPVPMTREEWEERGRRLEAARQIAEERRPKACPNVGCGSDDLFCTFDPTHRSFECNACGNVWEVTP